MSPQSIQSALGAMRKSGSIFGVLFSDGEEELFSDLAYTPERIAELSTILNDIVYYFEQENREPDTLAFSYDGGNLMILLKDGLRLVVLHHNADEADFIASAAGAFLKDYRVGRAIASFEKNGVAEVPEPTAPPARVAQPNRKTDPTQPIAPAVS